MSSEQKGGERRSFVGVSRGGTPEEPASLEAALANAAAQAVRRGAVTKRRPVWYEITSLRAEVANQHIKTFTVTITPQG